MNKQSATILKFPKKEWKVFNQSYRVSGPDKDISGGPLPPNFANLSDTLGPVTDRANAHIEGRIKAFLARNNAKECGERQNFVWIDSKPGKVGAYLCVRVYILHTG